jgi:hypothetical protein
MTHPEDSYRPTRDFTGWWIGVIIAIAVLAIAYLVFAANRPISATAVESVDEVRTDLETGCQYITNYSGGITPRLGDDCKHICTQTEESGL